MPLSNDEIVGLAVLREFMEGEADDLYHLRDTLMYDDLHDDDANDVSMAAFYYNLAADYINKVLNRHDKMMEEERQPSKELVLVREGNVYWPKEETVEKKLTEMTPQEIGEGTVLFDPKGEAWVASLWTEKVMDLKNGHVTKANVKPKDLVGWTFDGKTFDETLADKIQEIRDKTDVEQEGFAGFVAAEIVKERGSLNNPIGLIKAINSVLEKA